MTAGAERPEPGDSEQDEEEDVYEVEKIIDMRTEEVRGVVRPTDLEKRGLLLHSCSAFSAAKLCRAPWKYLSGRPARQCTPF